jgi:hypothetical protein
MINWLPARFRGRFPYEGCDRWSQSPDRSAAGLKRSTLKALRLFDAR